MKCSHSRFTGRYAPVLIALAALALGVSPARAQSTAAPRATDLHWLAGCWERRTGTLLIEEQWLAPRAGVLLGVNRTTRGDLLVGYEFMRIYSRGDTLVFAAQPSGQTPAEFVAHAIGAREVTFENPDHDFPQRIRYRAVGADSLLARIEGSRDGRTRAVDFPYARVECAPAAGRPPAPQ